MTRRSPRRKERALRKLSPGDLGELLQLCVDLHVPVLVRELT
ncbi:MAG: hypothetical protein AAF771_15005 [Pseudomonadota bacterium]